MEWKIGNKTISNQVVMAPMAGVSNPTYMRICEDMGVGYAVTELISTEAIVRDNKKTLDMLNGIDKLNIPYAIQLFGSNVKNITVAAKKINELYPKAIIDLNMGCPVPKIALKSEAGSALMKNPDKVQKIVSSVVKDVKTPVTVKIRSGWDAESINATQIAKICEEAGASAIAIHARTRKQGYTGNADWQIIKDVVNSVNIPVIGNGDVRTCYDAKRMLEETGCTAVMIGRALFGNPWLVKECVNYLDNGGLPEGVSVDEKIDMMEHHLKELLKDKNEVQAVLEIRGHMLSYLAGLPNNKEIKSKICTLRKSEDIIRILEEYRANVN